MIFKAGEIAKMPSYARYLLLCDLSGGAHWCERLRGICCVDVNGYDQCAYCRRDDGVTR